MAGQNPNMEQFEVYFLRADMDRDGRVSGNEAIAFFKASNLPQQVLAQIWGYADQKQTGFLGRPEFYNALKLVTVAQSKRALTPDIVKAALYGPASSQIPAPQINLAALSGPQSTMKVGVSPAQPSGTPTSTQGVGVSGSIRFPSQHNQFVVPPQPRPPSSGFQSHLGVSGQGIPVAGSQYPTSSNLVPGSTDGSRAGISAQVSNRSLNTANKEGIVSVSSPITQPKPPESTGFFQSGPSMHTDTASQVGKEESKPLSATGNMFSVAPSQPKQNSTQLAYSSGSIPASSNATFTSLTDYSTMKPNDVSQPPAIQAHQPPSTEKKVNQHVLAPNPVGAGNLASAQPQPPWPRMTPSDVQKYSKVFVQVDTDRDGKITAEQARDLFLSWRLPQGVLKLIWDLSDQDNDRMLSLREFCIALYLMERFREGRPLPNVLPNSVIDGSLFPSPGQPAAAYGYQQPQGTKNARPPPSAGGRKPPRPVPVPQPDEPIQEKAKVPVLEKHLVDQLSTEEQDSLNKKLEEAKDAEKKVADLEKDIVEAKQKIQFYRAKMQELILYKSRCDNRLNEITSKVVEDKKEAESLAKKYEEKYNKNGAVSSRLTIEESTFRDIQEKKMELYRAIVRLEHDKADGIQDRANKIQLEVEELVKALNERCKTYGLRAKPTSLLELPFGWQSGIEAAAADWDEAWDVFEDEGFMQVKELTLEVQNIIAPPKPKTSLIRERVTSLDSSDTSRSPSKADDKSELTNSELDNERPKANIEKTARSPPGSPAGSNAAESPSKELHDLRMRNINVNGSPRAFDTQSEIGGADSVHSGEKGFDEPGWDSFDAHYDSDAQSEFNSFKDFERERRNGSSLFGDEDWGLNPIKTTSTDSDRTFPNQGPFFDSVPSTPLYNSTNSPNADNIFSGKPFGFADSMPSTPMYNSSISPRKFNEDQEEHYSFESSSFSRFDSFNMHDSGPFGSRNDSFTRFDSMRSTRDSEYDQGYFAPQESLTRFDSFRSTADSDYNFGQFTPRDSSFSRFDSMRSSTRESDYGHGFPSFDDGADPFGSSDPFKVSSEDQTPRKDSDSWKAF
ncbi:hypothetical protein ACP275_08G225500 [Erythranthe tilingii]